MNAAPEPDAVTWAEQLSAYVDGELDDATSRAVEARLAVDPAAREEFQRMQRAWTMLDELPRGLIDPSFTATTVEMVAVAAAEELAATDRTAPRQRWLGRAAWATALVGSLAAGYLAVTLWQGSPNAALLADLPVIVELDRYRHAESLAFVDQLRDRGWFALAPVTPVNSAAPSAASVWRAVPPDRSARRTYVRSLTSQQQEELLSRLERFEQMSGPQRATLRAFARQLDDHPQATELRATLAAYDDWLLQLPSVQRAELLALPTAERLTRIGELRRHDLAERSRRLAPDDVRVVAEVIERSLTSAPAPDRFRLAIRLMSPRWSGFDSRNQPLPELNEIRERLSPAGRDQLAAAQAMPQRMELLAGWIRQALDLLAERAERDAGPTMAETQLRTFFEKELPENERERLLALPAEELRNQLRRMQYLRSLLPPGATLGSGGGFPPGGSPGKFSPSGGRHDAGGGPDGPGSPGGPGQFGPFGRGGGNNRQREPERRHDDPRREEPGRPRDPG